MTALIQTFVDLIGVFVVFIQTYLIPTTAADVSILHVAIWTPVVLGLLSLTVRMLKGMWARRA